MGWNGEGLLLLAFEVVLVFFFLCGWIFLGRGGGKGEGLLLLLLF